MNLARITEKLNLKMKKTLNELHGKAMDILKSKEDSIIKDMKMHNAKYTVSGREVKNIILRGVNSIAKPVVGTLGAGGIYQGHYISDGTPVILNDGVTVAQSLLPLPNIYENLIATLVLQAAQKTAMVAGDGCQDLNSRVLTPEGFKRFGDLKIGDTICGTNGTFQTVEGIYPKGVKQLYKFTFSDKRSTEACDSHLWKVINDWGKEEILTTKQIIESNKVCVKRQNGKKKHGYYIPNTFVDFKETQPLILDPYFLGCLLGDGSLSGTGAIELSLGAKKEHVLDKLVLPSNTTYTKNWVDSKNYFRVKFKMIDPSDNTEFVTTKLKDLGLFGTNSHTKFIPEQYLYSSLETRKQILQGLLDTDGHKSKKGLYSFSSVNKKLAEQVLELFRSLGRPAVLRELIKDGKESYSNNTIYEVTERKGYKYGIQLISVEPTDKFVEVQCIKVSNNDSLYITEDYIVTHNTSRTIAMIQYLSNNLLKEKRFWQKESNPYDLLKGLNLAVNDALAYLSRKDVKITPRLKSLWKIAYTASHGNKEVADNIRKLYSQLEDWSTEIDFEKSEMLDDYIEMKKGYVIGLKSPSLNGQKKNLENPRLILCNFKLTDLGIFDYNIAKRAMTDPSPVIFIVKDYDHNIIKDLKERSKMHLVDLYLVKVDTFGPEIKKQLEDISLLSTAEIVGDEYEYNQEAVLYDMPKTRLTDASNPMPFYEMKISKAVLTNDETILEFNTPKEVLEAHIESLKEIEFKDKADLHNHTNRIKRLQGTTCTYYVGGNTLTEVDTKYYLVEDAVKACKSAIREGIVHGACRTDVSLSKHLESLIPHNENDDIIRSYKTFIKALRYPLEIMCSSTRLDYDKVLKEYLSNESVLFNFNSFEYEDKDDTNILDSLSSTKESILNAKSIIEQFLKLGYLTN